MRPIVIGILIVIAAGLWPCTPLAAQGTAQISGNLTDQSGSVLPGVEITATQIETGVSRNTISNETGAYVLSNLPIGPYRVEAGLPGFRTYVQTGIVLQVGASPVINIVLEVGQVSENVEVQANAALVETRSSGIGQVMDNQRILDLPLNGRQVTDLIMLSGMATPGATSGTLNGQQRNYPTVSISIGGSHSSGTTYLLDGGAHNDPLNNLNLPIPFPDALQEFKVESSAVPAKYGHPGSAAVNAVTKSGTNEIHGDFFEFLRDSHLNARNAFALTRDSLKRNQFGGTIGGPIARNKLFFFAGHQMTTQHSLPSTAFATIPTAQMVTGDFTTFASPACNAGRQVTLNAAAGFVNNRISPSAFSPQALNIISRLPQTSDPCGLVQFGRNNSNHENLTLGRVDYQKSDKHSLFTRFYGARLFTPSDFDPKNILAYMTANATQTVESVVVGDTYLINTQTVNNFRATLNRSLSRRKHVEMFDWHDVGVNAYVQLPKFIVNTFGTFSVGNAGAGTLKFGTTGFQFSDDVDLVRGQHEIGIGGMWSQGHLNFKSLSGSTGTFSFNGQVTGLSLVDFMVGRPQSFQQSNPNVQYNRQNTLGAYVQDVWKARGGVTVSAGIRWDPFTSWWEKRGQVAHFDKARFDAGLRSTVYPNAPAGMIFDGDPGTPDKAAHDNKMLKFSPRLGLAWDPTGAGRMTVRAAYGLFYDSPHLFYYFPMGSVSPWGSSITVQQPQGGFADPWLGYPGGQPFPIIPTKNTPFQLSANYLSYPVDADPTYIHQWNLSIQKQVGNDWMVSANYVGNSTIHLWTTKNLNPSVYIPGASCVLQGRTFSPCSATSNSAQRQKLSLENSQWGQYYNGLTETTQDGTANYNGMYLSVQRRAARGLTVQGNYTWSHCISAPSNWAMAPGAGGGELEGRRQYETGNCGTADRRHVVNFSTVYNTPQFANGALRAIASGWQLSGILRVSSGDHFSVSSGLDTSLTGATSRADQILATAYAAEKNADHWLNRAAFATPVTGTFGNMGPNTLQGPGSINIDFGLMRIFKVREKQTLQFRAEAFNLPNHTNLGLPSTSLTGATFGRILSASDPRIMQLAVKYVF